MIFKRINKTVGALVAATITFATVSVIGQSTPQLSRFQQRVENFHAYDAAATTEAKSSLPSAGSSATEAPTGFDNLTNGFTDQGTFDADRAVFEKVDTVADGLGPTYNAQSCRECHQNVVTGGASQVAEHRTGHQTNGHFFESLGGSLVQSRATHPDIVEQVTVEDDIRSFRISTNTLGDGFVEAIADGTLIAIRDNQPAAMRGTALVVPVLETSGESRIGRFGWKCQHGSLESFAGDAYLNEVGITNPLFPDENTSSGRYVGFGTGYDPRPEPEDDGGDIAAFATFMRATKAPSRGPTTPDVRAGEQIFNQIGCSTCHTSSITTSPAGTAVNGGKLVVSPALGNKIIHPFSDFLLHDIGSGDGIPFLPTAEFASTARQIRTAPLWGLRTRNRLMHDGLSFTKQEAIRRHAGQATSVSQRFDGLSAEQQRQLLAFLNSL